MKNILNFELLRSEKIINEIIIKLKLDLDQLIILTEVGRDYSLFFPIIAAKANAKKVYAWAKDSLFGSADDIIKDCREIVKLYNIDEDIIEFSSNQRPEHHVADADIITNSSTLRPLNYEILKHAKEGCVIPLMYDKWKFRNIDVDIDYCRERKFKVAGTFENHPHLLIQNAIGNLAQKLIYDSGLKISPKNYFIWSDDIYGKVISEAINNFGANSVINSIDSIEFDKALPYLNVLFICDFMESRIYFSKTKEAIFNIDKLIKVNPTLTIIHLFGNIDSSLLLELGFNVFPIEKGQSQKMSCSLGYLGPKPLIHLYAGGLKVAMEMKENKFSTLSQQLV